MQGKLFLTVWLAPLLVLHFSQGEVLPMNSQSVGNGVSGSGIYIDVPWEKNCETEDADVGPLFINTCASNNPCLLEIDDFNNASFVLKPFSNRSTVDIIITANEKIIEEHYPSESFKNLEANKSIAVNFHFTSPTPKDESEERKVLMTYVLRADNLYLVCRKFEVTIANGGGFLAVSVLFVAVQQAFVFLRYSAILI